MKTPGTWRLVLDGGISGAGNMARDEAVARLTGREDPPTLRVYRFEPPAVTVGRFQSLRGIDVRGCRSAGIDVVRRPTGGLAIFHSGDFTYGFVMGSDDRTGDRSRCFDMVAAGIRAALRELGVEARQVAHGGRSAREGWCFEGVYGVDLEWEGRKICGSAQRVYERSILQHGSLFLGFQEEAACRVDKPPGRTGGAAFATVGEAAGRRVGWDEMLEAFEKGFRSALGLSFERGRLGEAELEAAAGLEDRFRIT